MPTSNGSNIGKNNPWYPEGGPGRQLKARLRAGEVLLAPSIDYFTQSATIKLFQHAGYDFVYFEYEHTSFNPVDMLQTIQSARDNGLPVIAKTPQLERMEVAKLLEAGAVGVQLPRTETRQQVETLIEYLKFPPAGSRAVAPGWGNSDYRGVTDWQAWMNEQDQETTVVVHLETKIGYENAEQIVSTPGVDMVYTGPGDSSIELGHPGDYDHPEVRGPMEKVLELCKEYGVYFGTTPANAASARDWVDKGASYFIAGSDVEFMRDGAAHLVKEYREHIG